jgi:hypothetical protein
VLAAPRRQHERLMRTIVVGCTVVGVAGVALVASARDSSPATAGATAGFQQVDAPAVDTGATTTTVAAAAAGLAASADSAVADAPVGSDSAESSVPDLAIAGGETELTPDCIIAPESMSFNDSGVDAQCLQQALTRVG